MDLKIKKQGVHSKSDSYSSSLSVTMRANIKRVVILAVQISLRWQPFFIILCNSAGALSAVLFYFIFPDLPDIQP